LRLTAEREKKEAGKTRVGAGFFQTLASNFLLFRAWNPPLFIEIGRGIFCL
jgi:hypothetical protein